MLTLDTCELEIAVPGRAEPWRVDVLELQMLFEQFGYEGDIDSGKGRWLPYRDYLPKIGEAIFNRWQVQLSQWQLQCLQSAVSEAYWSFKKKFDDALPQQLGLDSIPSGSQNGNGSSSET